MLIIVKSKKELKDYFTESQRKEIFNHIKKEKRLNIFYKEEDIIEDNLILKGYNVANYNVRVATLINEKDNKMQQYYCLKAI